MRIAIALTLLIGLAAAIAARQYTSAPTPWTNPDSIFYQARTLDIRGEHTAPATVYHGPLGASARFFFPRSSQEVNADERFYDRRVLVPAIAAALYPFGHDRSLQIASLLGYVLAGVALFLLLRLRFGVWVSCGVAAVCLLAPPVRDASFMPMTDSWGLALQALAFLFGLLALTGRRRWLVAAFLAALALALSRDNGLALIAALGWVALTDRTRRSLAVVGAVAAGTLIPALVARVSATDYLAWTLNGFRDVHHDRLGFIASHWPDATWHTFKTLATGYWAFPGHAGTMVLALAALCGLAASADRDPYLRAARAGVVGAVAVVVLAAAPPGGLRIELVFVPFFAIGLARVAEAAGRALARIRRAQAEPSTA